MAQKASPARPTNSKWSKLNNSCSRACHSAAVGLGVGCGRDESETPRGALTAAQLVFSGIFRNRILPLKTQICVSVPVILVRRSAHANTRNDDGTRITAKSSKAPMEGHN